MLFLKPISDVEGVLNDCTGKGCKLKFNVVTEKITSPWLSSENIS